MATSDSPAPELPAGSLTRPLLDANGPLPEGTGLYVENPDRTYRLVGVLGPSVEREDEDGPYFTAGVRPPIVGA